jgi:CCR4-NOT complex subunit CAF16
MLLGKTTSAPLSWPPAEGSEGPKDLFHLALGWLKDDKVVRKEKEKTTGRIRGPKPEVSLKSVPTT